MELMQTGHSKKTESKQKRWNEQGFSKTEDKKRREGKGGKKQMKKREKLNKYTKKTTTKKWRRIITKWEESSINHCQYL